MKPSATTGTAVTPDCRSELAREKPMGAAGYLNLHVIVNNHRERARSYGSEKSQIPDSKKPAQGGLSVVTWRSVFQVTEYGAADGTRTRDPRRDRPVF